MQAKRNGRLTLDKTICQIIRSAYSSGEAVEQPGGLDPAAVYAELQQQTIPGLALVPGGLADVCKDKALVAKWTNLDLKRRVLFAHLLNVQDETLRVLTDADIKAVILKGAAAGMLYPDPALRSYGDIDCMVAPDDLGKARSALLAADFTGEDDEGVSDHHMGLEKDGVHLELHWRPNGIPQGAGKERLDGLFLDALAHTETATVQGHEFPVFPTMTNGVVLLLHARKHLAHGGLGFRQVIDWMMFARTYLAGEGWTEFRRLLDDPRLERTAKCLTRFCQVYLGMSEEGFPWCADVEPSVCASLLEHVMLLGNFGHKTKPKSGATALERVRGPISLFRYLQEGGMSNWKAARTHAILRPFAWIYQAGRCARTLLTREDSLARIQLDIDEAARRRKLAEEMGLYDL